MDQVDVDILNILQTDARIKIVDLSRKINMTQPSVKERMTKLEEKGIIDSYRAVISPYKVGKESTSFIMFQTSWCDDFIAFCEKAPEVVELHRISGQYNYLLKVVTNSMAELDRFTNSCASFGHSTALIVLNSPIEHKALVPEQIEE